LRAGRRAWTGFVVSGECGVIVSAHVDPVFVLCSARSGSTLLRFVLDAHPELACPPETNVPALCGQLATVWSLIEGAPLSPNRGDEPPEIPDAAIAGVRETMDRMVGSYLARRGKQRYCDKSLGTARFSYLLTRIWPAARFICLFRHPMDVIASGIEACPWGLNGYGFDPYVAETPGNVVFSLARYWADNAQAILGAEEDDAGRCHRVLYEDLVADPQAVADGIFGFLGVTQLPGVAGRIFAPEREQSGPADYKIWHTSAITADSVGRGWAIPAGLIAPQVRAVINDLCGKLGYAQVDDQWGGAVQPPDVRVASGAFSAGTLLPGSAAAAQDGQPQRARASVVRERLEAGLARTGESFALRWGPYAAEQFELIVTLPGSPAPAGRWLVDLASRMVGPLDGAPAPDPEPGALRGAGSGDEDPGSSWQIIGSAETWEQVTSGRLNMSVALRRNALRYCDEDPAPMSAETRIALLAELFQLTSWRRARQEVSTRS
jgi:hypothetical protein